jgi:hypothetical protein
MTTRRLDDERAPLRGLGVETRPERETIVRIIGTDVYRYLAADAVRLRNAPDDELHVRL